MLVVSLVGVVVSLHAGLQLQAGFPSGCLGLGLVQGSLATCSNWVHGGVPSIAGVESMLVVAGYCVLVALVTTAFFVVAYALPSISSWVALGRLGLLAIGGGLSLFYGVAAFRASGGMGALASVFAAVTVVMLGLGVAAAVSSPRTNAPFMKSAHLSPRAFRRETVVVVWLIALTVILVGAEFVSYGAVTGSRSVPGVSRPLSDNTGPAIRAAYSFPADAVSSRARF